MNIKLRKTLVAIKMIESVYDNVPGKMSENIKTVVKRFIGYITTYFVAGSSF